MDSAITPTMVRHLNEGIGEHIGISLKNSSVSDHLLSCREQKIFTRTEREPVKNERSIILE